MAYTVLPKEDPVRNNKHVTTILDRRTDDKLIGPELSWTIDWHPETKKWWDEIRQSELATILETSDWRFLQDTALMHHRVWNDNRISIAMMTNAMAEIRQRVAKFGATFEDRIKLRIKFADAQKKEQANALPKDSRINYRQMFEGEVVNDSPGDS